MRKIISITMCLMLLASTSGVAYAQHFCGDFEILATLTLGDETLSCDMVSEVDDGCANESAEDHSCCADQYTKITTDDNFNESQQTYQVPTNFVGAFVSVVALQFENATTNTAVAFSIYAPPPLIKNIPVLYESFLI